MKKESDKKCLICNSIINIKIGTYVVLSTFNINKSSDNSIYDEIFYFHIDCWKKYFEDAVNRKARIIVTDMQQKALKLFNNPIMEGMLGQIKGSDQLLDVVKKPLVNKIYDIDDLETLNKKLNETDELRKFQEENIKNGRKEKDKKKENNKRRD